MKLSHKVRNTGKTRFSQIILHLLLKTRISLTVAPMNILHVSRFPSDLVHRHIFLLTLLLLEKMMIICPDNAL